MREADSTKLEVEDISINFGGVLALDRVGLRVGENRISSLIGPNGAGKSTLFNVICGIYRPRSGKVFFESRDITGLQPHEVAAVGIGRTFQNIGLFPHMTVLENLLVAQHGHIRAGVLGLALSLPGARREEERARERVKQVLDFLGLSDVQGSMARDLPFGLQKLTELGRALALQPKLLLLDEPSGGMNDAETDQLANILRAVRDDLGITVLLVEHDMRLVMGLSDYVCVLHYGKKLAEGSPNEVQADPRVTEAYLGAGDLAGA